MAPGYYDPLLLRSPQLEWTVAGRRLLLRSEAVAVAGELLRELGSAARARRA